MICYYCGAPDPPKVPMTEDEARYGLDMRQCTVCGYFQNHAGEELHVCSNGNQTICATCRDAIFKAKGTRRVSNKEMRRIIKENGGCLTRIK